MSAHRISREELALAYELRQEGCCWKNIAKGLGWSPETLMNAISRVMRFGLTDEHG